MSLFTKFRTITFVLIICASASVAISQSRNKTEDSLKGLVQQMADAQIAYDSATLDRLFAADYIEISPAGEFDTREEVLGFYKPVAKRDAAKSPVRVEATDHSIRVYDKFAIVITQLNFVMTDGGQERRSGGIRVTLVFRKVNDAWKIASAQYTGIRPPKTQ